MWTLTEISQLFVRIFAVCCIGVGLLTFPTPIPSGIPLMAVGLVLLLTHSRLAPVWVRGLRRRSATADRLLTRVESSAPGRWRSVFRRTRRYRRGPVPGNDGSGNR